MCDDKTSTRHRFPNPKKNIEFFNQWKDILLSDKLKSLSTEQIYDKLRVCDIHFEKECHSVGYSRLNANSLPTLLIPGNFI